MTSRHRAHPMLFLLALLFLATTIIGPAVADVASNSASQPVGGYMYTMYAEARAGELGALETLQLQLMIYYLHWGLDAYAVQTGAQPASPQDLIDAGAFPFRPLNRVGQPIELEILAGRTLPGPDAVGIQQEENRWKLILMGADGDPLTPMIAEEESRQFGVDSLLPGVPWERRLPMLLEKVVQEQCSNYVDVTSVLPTDPATMMSTLLTAPVGVAWRSDAVDPAIGIRVEIDAGKTALRFSRFPSSGYTPYSYMRFSPATAANYASLKSDPLVPVTTDQWQLFGTLEQVTPLPDSIPIFEPPPLPEELIPPPDRVIPWGADIVLLDLDWWGAWARKMEKDGPPIEWMATGPVPLFALTNESGEIYPMQAVSQAEVGARDQDGILFSHQDRQTTLYWPHPAYESSTEWTLDRQFPDTILDVFAPWTSRNIKPPTAELVEQVHSYCQQNPENAELRDWYWQTTLSDPAHFDRLFIDHASDQVRDALGMWLAIYPGEGPPDTWEQVLSDLHLAQIGCRALQPGETPTGREATIELSLATPSNVLRMSLRMPDATSTIRYAVAAGSAAIEYLPSIPIGAINLPGVPTYDYQPIATFAIPIPDPPVLPEVAVP